MSMHKSNCSHPSVDKPRRGPNTGDGYSTLVMDCRDCQQKITRTMPKDWDGAVDIVIGAGASARVFV